MDACINKGTGQHQGHGLHSLSCIAEIYTRDLSAMKDTLEEG